MAKTYDLKKVILTVNGIPVTGFQDGDAVSVEFDSETWTKTVGSDGEVCRSRTNNNTGKVTITLMYSSMVNDAFNAQKVLDRATGLGTVSILIKDLSSASTVFVPQAWIQKEPTQTYGKEMGNREWVFDCSAIEKIDGGIPGLAL